MLAAVSLLYLAATPSVELIDLLDFDKGTVLLTAPPSRGEDLAAWSAFYLADGSAKDGWASPRGSPVGAEFVYELEQDSELFTLRVINTGAEETAFPGISARMIEMWAAGATGKFELIGVFEAARGAEKEFPLTVAKPVRRVKFVIASNWGNANATEVMELDLMGRKAGTAPTVDAVGEYYSPLWRGLRIKQDGKRIQGCYDFNDGTFAGELEGRVARVVWSELIVNGKPHSKGSATFVASSDKTKMRGIYFVDGDLAPRGTWDLDKPSGPEQVPKCKLPNLSMREQLALTGHMVTYGVHFEVNSDVPRADSEPTLNDMLQTMKDEAWLKLQVEGYTDATNSAAYNQNLSERRAHAVVQWLLDKGISVKRLKSKGFGMNKPVASNDTAQGRALNRRVELSVMK